ncbi:MAG: hypothetical protein JXR70_09400 [Spirochaetales bacterium]|nr:hypothetical protein [Spirochaetales bacterium]
MMLLQKNSIEEKALEIYQRSVKDRRINEDICSDIYLLFIKRMNRYKEKHPELAEVSDGFIASVVRFIIRDLNKKQYKIETRDEVLETVCQGLVHNQEPLSDDNLECLFENKLSDYIQQELKGSSIRKEQALCFILFYSNYFSTEQVIKLITLAGFDFNNWERALLEIKECALARSFRKLVKLETALSTCFYRVIQIHGAMQKVSADKKDKWISDYKKLAQQRHNAIVALKRTIVLPSYKEAALVLGIKEEGFRYSVNTFMKNFFIFAGQHYGDKKQLAA